MLGNVGSEGLGKMLSRVFVSLVLVITAIPAAYAAEADSAVLQTGDILPEDVPKRLDGWLGLYPLAEGYVVEPVTLTIERYQHPLADDEKDTNPDHWTGRMVKAVPRDTKVREQLSSLKDGSSSEASEPIILFRYAGMKRHHASALFPGNGMSEQRLPGTFAPMEAVDFTLGDIGYRLSGSFQETSCELKLSASSLSSPSAEKISDQILGKRFPENSAFEYFKRGPFIGLYCEHGGANYPRIIWAGDLDEDKKLDLLLEYDTDSTYVRALFLSSAADKGQLVKLIGGFVRPAGC